MVARLNTVDWILLAKQKHGEKFDYSRVNYISKRDPVDVCCPKHGWFKVRPCDHVRSVTGCYQCGREDHAKKRSKPNSKQYTRHTIESFIESARAIHGDTYDYSNVKYLGVMQSIEIVCAKHGAFRQKAVKHLEGQGCRRCGNNSAARKSSLKTSDFIRLARQTHGDLYGYDRVEYENAHKKIIILCHDHGYFQQSPRKHLMMQGCPLCNKSSIAEVKIAESLSGTSLTYKKEKTFPDCRNKKRLRFDFAIYNGKTLIGIVEYHGGQHYRSVGLWGGDAGFAKRTLLDGIKRDYCIKNGIPLLEIPYWDIDRIDAIMFNWINARLGKSNDQQIGLI